MRYINIESARPGMIVGKSIYNEQGSVLVNYRVKLTEKLIDRMREMRLQGLYINDDLSSDIQVEDLISDELSVKATRALANLDIDEALSVANDIVDELSIGGDINVDLVSMRTESDYTYKHSVNVAVLSVLIGISIGLKKQNLKELSVAGLLHDVGKLNIPLEVIDKRGSLTEEEYEMVKKHSQLGFEKLKGNVNISSKTKMGVYMHHENINGTGYPLGLQGDQIYMFAKIIHIADVYDAITNDRPYKKAQAPQKALEFLMNNAGKLFQPEYVKAFINYIPIYPKGRNVILSDQSVAVVVKNRECNTLYPVVRRLSDGETIDLSDQEEGEGALSILGFEGLFPQSFDHL